MSCWVCTQLLRLQCKGLTTCVDGGDMGGWPWRSMERSTILPANLPVRQLLYIEVAKKTSVHTGGRIKLVVGARHSFQSNLVVGHVCYDWICMPTDCATSVVRRCGSLRLKSLKRPGLQQYMHWTTVRDKKQQKPSWFRVDTHTHTLTIWQD